MSKLNRKEKINRNGRLAKRAVKQRRKRNPRWRGNDLHPRYMMYWKAVFDMMDRRWSRFLQSADSATVDGGETNG